MATSPLQLTELITIFEGYVPDKTVSDHLTYLASSAPKASAHYHYLLARLYERLAHHNQLADPPRTLARLLFYESLTHYQRAAEKAPNELISYFSGKRALLHFFLFSIPDPNNRHYRNPSNLVDALSHFSVAAHTAPEARLKGIFSWLYVFTLLLLRRTEAANLLQRDLDQAEIRFPELTGDWEPLIERHVASLDTFERDTAVEISSLDLPRMSKEQREYLDGMRWMMKARLHEDLHRKLLTTYRALGRHRPDSLEISALLQANWLRLLSASSRFTTTLQSLGMDILKCQIGAQMKHLEADFHFDRRVAHFGTIVRRETKSDLMLSQEVHELLFEATEDLLEEQVDGLPTGAILDLFEANGYALTDQAGLAVFGDHAIIFDKTRRYRIQRRPGGLTVYHANHAPIPFDLAGPEVLYKYYLDVRETTGLYFSTIRETLAYLRKSAQLYTGLLATLSTLPAGLRTADIESLELSLEKLKDKANTNRSSLLDLFQGKMVYLWSLLEMFEMRKDVVRLNTLYSGECRLVMRDPHQEGRLLEIGADPVFRLAMPLLFRGSRGNDDIRRFLKLLLRSAANTAREQERCLKKEIQYLEPKLSGSYRELWEVYRCHERLAEALLSFIDPFVAHLGDLKEETLSTGEASIRLLLDALRAYGDAIRFRSPLVGDGSIDFFLAYIEGVLQGRRGMLFRQTRATTQGGWDAYYERAEKQLRKAQSLLEQIEDSYLLVSGGRKQEFLGYLSARIATVAAWKERYYFEDTKAAKHAVRSSELFRTAAEHLTRIGDVQIATQATARATEIEALLQTLHKPSRREDLYLKLRQAAALFATCGDLFGFERTRTFLATLFPERESTSNVPTLLPIDQAREAEFSLTDRPEVGAAFERLMTELIGDSGEGSIRLPTGVQTVLRLILNYAWFELKDPRLRFMAYERECRKLLRNSLALRGRPGEIEVPSGKGRVDFLVNGIPVEVKRATTLSPRLREDYRTQAAQYALSEGQSLCILLIHSFTSIPERTSVPVFSQLVSCYRGKGNGPVEEGVAIVEITIPQYEAVPSRPRRRNGPRATKRNDSP